MCVTIGYSLTVMIVTLIQSHVECNIPDIKSMQNRNKMLEMAE
jgi:hypothetical protein